MERFSTSYRLIAPLAALLLFLSLTSLYAFGDRDLYTAIVRLWGVVPGPFGPFLDMQYVTAAWQCHHLGIDVVVRDPCDPLNRPFSYSPLWLLIAPYPLGARAADAFAWGSDLLFLLGLFLLPPARRARDVPILVLAALSTMVFYAVERANADIVIFMLVLGAGFLALRSSWARLAAYPIFLFAGLLKYYPLSLLALTLRERVTRFLVLDLAALALLLLFAVRFLPDLEHGLPSIASGSYFTDLFGAKNLPFGIAETLNAIAGAPFASGSPAAKLCAYGLYLFLALMCAGLCARILKLESLRPALAKLTPTELIFLAIGGLLITGCFFAGQSVGYRGIFFLFVLPGLLAVAREAGGKSLRRVAGFASAAAVFLMWGEFFRVNLLAGLKRFPIEAGLVKAAWFDFWLFRELAWWGLVSVMAAMIVQLLSQSEMGQVLFSFLGRGRDVFQARAAKAGIEDPAGKR